MPPTLKNVDGLDAGAIAERERCATILQAALGNHVGRESLAGAYSAIVRGWPADEFDPLHPTKRKRA